MSDRWPDTAVPLSKISGNAEEISCKIMYFILFRVESTVEPRLTHTPLEQWHRLVRLD